MVEAVSTAHQESLPGVGTQVFLPAENPDHLAVVVLVAEGHLAEVLAVVPAEGSRVDALHLAAPAAEVAAEKEEILAKTSMSPAL